MFSSYLVTDSGIVVLHNGQYATVSNDHPKLAEIKQALVDEEYDTAIYFMNLREVVKQFLTTDEKFTLENDLIVLDGRAFSDAVTDKVLRMIESGNKAQPLFNFLENVRSNPSKSAQDELLLFCVANGFMITDDGAILAYKSVRGDYMDIHSGTIRNAVGDKVSMERNDVDDNRNVTCSDGLHFAAYGYASTWAGAIDGVNRKLMLMKVNPRDVVSIPSDYNNQKGRCCQYEVLDEIMPTVISDGIMHIEPLPHQEVFNLSNEPVMTREDYVADLTEKMYVLGAEIDEIDERHENIEVLGGEPTYDELEYLDTLNREYCRLSNLKDEQEDISECELAGCDGCADCDPLE